MAHHDKGKSKRKGSSCLLCKPHKAHGVKKRKFITLGTVCRSTKGGPGPWRQESAGQLKLFEGQELYEDWADYDQHCLDCGSNLSDPDDQGCYWCGYSCAAGEHGPWEIGIDWPHYKEIFCAKCRMPKEHLPDPLAQLAALGRQPGLFTLDEIWPREMT